MPQMSDLVLDDIGDSEPQFTRRDLAPGHHIVFETIEREILDGRLQPGDRLPSGTALADQLGVDRSTTREELSLLEEAASCSAAADGAAVPHQDELASRASCALIVQQIAFSELW